LEECVAPAYPELFASGCIINGFTPKDDKNKNETDSLLKSIKNFKVDIVIVIENERLENEIRNRHWEHPLLVLRMPKSQGVEATKTYGEERL
jgi:DNA polymerase III delta subunit